MDYIEEIKKRMFRFIFYKDRLPKKTTAASLIYEGKSSSLFLSTSWNYNYRREEVSGKSQFIVQEFQRK